MGGWWEERGRNGQGGREMGSVWARMGQVGIQTEKEGVDPSDTGMSRIQQVCVIVQRAGQVQCGSDPVASIPFQQPTPPDTGATAVMGHKVPYEMHWD